MIIAKTDMAELPTQCNQCGLFKQLNQEYGYCQVTKFAKHPKAPLNMCPLEEVKEKDND